VVVLAFLGSGCATTSGAEAVRVESPDDGCELLGPIAVRMSNELLLPEGALFDTALTELRRRAAMRGATHLVLATSPTHGALAYGTTAEAAGLAYRCPDQR